ncbi:hypothetical protein JG687_00004161 [Phytophthora cactorum]|uniref:Uncharacterized protein n=1 Tax=Phytophthora cactorum TaxID=29920 RepID=A0A8T1UQK2_9STRA|nr:hypothetical protein JG687_00004161 [Phytophthora cactorum]
MAFVAKLQDVEQQLLRATQVVQLHVRLADTGPAELEEAEEKGIVGFIESVERAQRGLENIMTQLLVLAKCRVSKSSREEEVDEKTARVEMRRRLALKSSMSTNRMRRMMKLSIMSSRKDDPVWKNTQLRRRTRRKWSSILTIQKPLIPGGEL